MIKPEKKLEPCPRGRRAGKEEALLGSRNSLRNFPLPTTTHGPEREGGEASFHLRCLGKSGRQSALISLSSSSLSLSRFPVVMIRLVNQAFPLMPPLLFFSWTLP